MSCKNVSIIIPTYNEEANLAQCLESLDNLNYPHERIEIIVVDNGSTDRTREIARNFNVKLYQAENKYIAGLRNLGVQQASGEIIAFVDADCIVAEDWLQQASNYFDNPHIAAWGSPALPPFDLSWVQKTWYLVRSKKHIIQEVDWLESMNFFMRKKQFLEINGFNEALVTCEDVDISYRLQGKGKIISDMSIKVIHHGEAATVKEFFKKEAWRGQGNFAGLTSHKISFKELPSLVLPLYFVVIIPIFIFGFFIFNNLLWLSVGGFFYIFPTLFVLLKVALKNLRISLKNFLQLSFLLQVYFFSKIIALLKNVPHAPGRKMPMLNLAL